jgi:hypothetical protein
MASGSWSASRSAADRARLRTNWPTDDPHRAGSGSSVGQFVRDPSPDRGYAGGMFWIILLVVVVAAFVIWKMRVPLLAKILGQSESRIDRQLNRRK